ncbi:serine hydrolase domain-containing protein [Amycolatopsis minnesotensis]|uniref:serine hydrolase domain-containing protein n=1 Tax=Amycolatopsis minnesotensis TaxID=337894 RepID=UPI0031DA9790
MNWELIDTALSAEVAAGRLPGAVVGILHRGAVVHLSAVGYRDPVARVPMTEDTLFWLASMTKPVTTAGALQLLDLGTELGGLLPEFAGRAVQPTVLDLLRHTSGIVEGLLGSTEVHRRYANAVGDGMTAFTGDEFVGRLAPLPLLHAPGERWHYGWGLDLIGLAVERRTGGRLGDFLRDAVFRPLGMTETGFGVADPDRYAKPLPGESLPDLSRARFDSGGAGLVGTAEDYLAFVAALLGHRPLLTPSMVDRMTTDRLEEGTDVRGLEEMRPHHTFGLGVAVHRDTGAYTWPGAGGTTWWADPARDLGVVFLAHSPGRAKRNHAFIGELVERVFDTGR